MINGNFLQALQNLTSWLGYWVLPTLAALCLCIAIFNYSNGRRAGRFVTGSLLCLMGPGCALLIQHFVVTPTSSNADVVSGALMNAVSYLGNVIMPIFAVVCVIRGVIDLGAPVERFHARMETVKHFGAALLSLMVSGLVRLLEHFVATSTQLTPGTHSLLLNHFLGAARCLYA
jgi:hypothetical protein